MASHIKDSNLWESGELKLSWVRSHMPLLDGIRLEDDVLITPDGARRLGSRRLPIAPDDVEAVMK